MSNDVAYRRIWVTYSDEGTWSMHGSCTQNVSVWIGQSGAVADVFVSRMSCPI